LRAQVAPPIPAKRRKPPRVAFNDDKSATAAEAGEAGWGGDLRQRSPKGGDSDADGADARTNRTNVKAKLEKIHSERLAEDVVPAARKDVPVGVPSAPPLHDIWAVPSAAEERSPSQSSDRLYDNLAQNEDDAVESTNPPLPRKSEHEYEDYADEDEDEEGGRCACGTGCAGMICCGGCEDLGGGCCASLHRPDGVGPMAKPRKSRDVMCMVLFVFCWIFWILLVWTTITDGCPDDCNDPRRLIYGADSHTNEMCGQGALASRPKLFFPFPENPVARRMCVSECPGVLTNDVRVARGLGLVEHFGGSAEGEGGVGGVGSAGVVVGDEVALPL
jgi:hypothetical protein